MGKVVAPPSDAIDLVLVGDDPLLNLIRRMISAGYHLTEIAAFLRDQADILAVCRNA